MNIIFFGLKGGLLNDFSLYCKRLLNMPIIDLYSHISNNLSQENACDDSNYESLTDYVKMLNHSIIICDENFIFNDNFVKQIKKTGITFYLQSQVEMQSDLQCQALESFDNQCEKYSDISLDVNNIYKIKDVGNKDKEGKLSALYVELCNKLEQRVYEGNKKLLKGLR